jgi:hypothetical protein
MAARCSRLSRCALLLVRLACCMLAVLMVRGAMQIIEGGKLKQTTRIKVNHDATTGKAGEWYTYYSVFVRQ